MNTFIFLNTFVNIYFVFSGLFQNWSPCGKPFFLSFLPYRLIGSLIKGLWAITRTVDNTLECSASIIYKIIRNLHLWTWLIINVTMYIRPLWLFFWSFWEITCKTNFRKIKIVHYKCLRFMYSLLRRTPTVYAHEVLDIS